MNVLVENILRLATRLLDDVDGIGEGTGYWANASSLSTRSDAADADDGENALTTASTIVLRASTDPWFMTTVGLVLIVLLAVALIGSLILLAACCCYCRSKKDSCSYELAAAMQLAPKSDAQQVQREFYV